MTLQKSWSSSGSAFLLRTADCCMMDRKAERKDDCKF